MPSNLSADIAWYQQQIESCNGALASLASEPESPSRRAEQHLAMEALGRYQATLEHLLRLRAMIERSGTATTAETL